ncbi:putative DNA-binding protein [Brucella phage Pr]|uniref:Putative DNA-binding protein n=1 Tax=Brucella phage Pr TaxID=1133293 RepID=H2EIE5_9CAUD|nr:putative DNA-binding protein [Brucella phage Pr]AEY69777.1 putative DNA-binding protein [Brucella phage Pr]
MDYDCISKLIKYSPESGKLFWVKRDDVCKSWNTRYAGKEAFTATLNGYKYGKILGKNYYAHRIAWLIMNGEFADEIDHIDGNRSNNIYNNLRSVSHQNNMKNITMQSNNNSGVVGVYWNRSRCKWHAHR